MTRTAHSVALGCTAALVAALASAAGKTHIVVIDGVAYAPAALAVKQGDTVVWHNKDPFPRTVTAAGRFDSGSLGPERKWKLVACKPAPTPT